METSFSVKAGEFEGPLDLLLNLIEERKMLVSDVSLSQVADDFLAYLQTHVAFPVGQAAHFVVVAATLLLIKSRTLLPVLSLTDEEEGDMKDLEFRLGVYQMIRNAARAIGSLTEHMFFGSGARITDPLFTPPKDMTIASIQEAAHRALQSAPEMSQMKEVSVQTVISLEEMIDRLSERITKAVQMTFRDFAGGSAAGKGELVVGFLAMLELVKRGLLMAEQRDHLGEITMNYSGEIHAPKF
ncbi:segregation/condensation protein A [Candidatus Kaiserbacteria bacterium]|nr:segregation/condensation protein A [Candidatus Kaiserbacteria bacterium]